MGRYLSTAGLCVLWLCAPLISQESRTAETSRTVDGPTIQALLAEVQQLRLALERFTLIGPRMQLTLQRAQWQEDRHSRLSRQLEDVRKQLGESSAQEAMGTTGLKELEGRIGQEQNPLLRKQMEEEYKAIKIRLEQNNVLVQQYRGREIELANALQKEQDKLNDFNEQLNSLERILETLPPATARPEKKQP